MPEKAKYRFYREQQLFCDMDTAWAFFSSPHNLSRITPRELKFTVLNNPTENIFEGMVINYKVSPLFGIPLSWRTKITHVENHKSFIDFQEKGPYKMWSHLHEFISNSKGVLMKDTVDYELPLGILGNIAHFLFVKKKLDFIFDHRFQVLEKCFNKKH